MHRGFKRALAQAGGIAVALSVMVGCSSSSSGGDASTTNSAGPSSDTTSAPALSGSPIRIGVMSEQSGYTFPADSYPKQVAQAWQGWVNANGGLNGHPVEVFVGDSKTNPATGQAEVQRLVEDEHVIALVGNGDVTEGGYKSYINEHKIPIVGGTPNTTTWPGDAMYFPVATTPLNYFALNPYSLAQVGAKSVGLFVCAENPQCALSEGVIKPAAATAGIKYDGLLKISQTAPDYTAPCLQMKQQNADAIIALVQSESVQRIAADCGKQSYSPWLVADGGGVDESLTKAKSLKLIGVMQAFPWTASDAPVVQFRKVMEKYAPGKSYGNPTATATWVSLEIFRKAMAKTGPSPTSADVIAALRAMPSTTLDGLLPQAVKYSADAPGEPDIKCGFTAVVQDGKFKAEGLKPLCPTGG